MLYVALFGPPGAGKGTQSELLIKKYNLTYISTGDILRQEIKENTKLGLLAKSRIDKGELVSDEIIVQIIEKKIAKNPESNGILFDGFPRTVVQAFILEGLLLRFNVSLTCMLSLEVPESELMKRLINRKKTSGRSDDNEHIIEKRLEEYQQKTVPVADFYREKEKYFPINGMGDLNKIFERLIVPIEKVLEKKWINIVMFGPPGAGKGKHAQKIAKKYNLAYVATGEILVQEIREKTDLGRKVKESVEKGGLVPDEIVIELIQKSIEENPGVHGFIFKGFPRTIVQAYILDGIFRRLNSSVACMINVKMPTLKSIRRLTARGKTEKGRTYDTDMKIVVKRLEEYEAKTAYVADHYKKKNIVYSINGDNGTVFEDICRIVDEVKAKVRR